MVSPDVTSPALPVRRNPLALAALIVAVVAVLLGAALGLGFTATIGTGIGVQGVGVLFAIRTVVVTLLGMAAVALGLIALLLPRRAGRPTAAAGLAIGAVLVFDGILGLLTPAILSAR